MKIITSLSDLCCLSRFWRCLSVWTCLDVVVWMIAWICTVLSLCRLWATVVDSVCMNLAQLDVFWTCVLFDDLPSLVRWWVCAWVVTLSFKWLVCMVVWRIEDDGDDLCIGWFRFVKLRFFESLWCDLCFGFLKAFALISWLCWLILCNL